MRLDNRVKSVGIVIIFERKERDFEFEAHRTIIIPAQRNQGELVLSKVSTIIASDAHKVIVTFQLK